MFTNSLNIHILSNGMGRKRFQLFNEALNKNGAHIIDAKDLNKILSEETVFLVMVDESLKDWESIEKIAFKKNLIGNTKVKFIKSCWLSECLKLNQYVDTELYEIKNKSNQNEKPTKNLNSNEQLHEIVNSGEAISSSNHKTDFIKIAKKKKLDLSHKFETDDEEISDSDSFKSAYSSFEFEDDRISDESKACVSNSSWTCAHSSKEQIVNHNKIITDKLEELCGLYESSKDKYRVVGYQKAIAILKNYPKMISTYKEAKSLRGVGKGIAKKVWEIIQTGELQKLNQFKEREDISSLKLFTNIHGIGPNTAQLFISQGFRTLQDLKEKANLNKNQKIGVKYFEDFLIRIPRSEVQEIEKIVTDAALSIEINFIVQTCGSYRRNKPTCGDVDILITHPNGKSHKGILHKLIAILHEKIDDLVTMEEDGSQKKYLGVCRLPGENKLHRRIDIIVVPIKEFACASLYFTGSAHFNRSMRLLACKMGMSLSEHSLCKNVIRKGQEKLNTGVKLDTPTEESVFKYLNLTFRPPEERDF